MGAVVSASGPFRSDARVEMTARVLSTAAAQLRAVKRARGLGLELQGYLAVLGLVTSAAGVALGGEARLAVIAGFAMLGIAMLHAKRHRDALAAHVDASPRTVALRDDGLEIDAGERRTFWSWSAVHGMRASRDAIVVELEWNQAIALEPNERVAQWLIARVGSSPRPAASRTLLMLAVLYAVLSLAVAILLPDWLGAP